MTFDTLLANLCHLEQKLPPIGGRQTKTKFSLNLIVVFYCYVNAYYSSEQTKIRSSIVVLEEVVRVDNTGCPSGTRS